MASTRLTKTTRKAFISAVMDDVPKPDDDAMSKELQAILYQHMPDNVRVVYNTHKEWLHKCKVYIPFGDIPTPTITYYWPEYGEVNLPDEAQEFITKLRNSFHVRQDFRYKLENIVKGLTTVKQLKDTFPELAKYAPDEIVPATKNLPVCANLMADIIALGWPKGKKPEGVKT